MASAWYCIFLVVAVVQLADASHFRGATINWKSIATPAEPGKVSITFNIAWRRSSSTGKSNGVECNDNLIATKALHGSATGWRCLSDNCGDQLIPDMQYECTAFSAADDWSFGTRTIEHTFPINLGPKFFFGIDPAGTDRCCWLATLQNVPGLSDLTQRVYTEINLGGRPDDPTRINTSPITQMIPVLPARGGCEHRVVIPNRDEDSDAVRCRWANGKQTLPDDGNDDDGFDECGGVCHDLDRPPFNAQLDETNCEIVWTPPNEGLYAVAVVLEDHIDVGGTTTYLSEVPLQFLIKVVEAKLPCNEKPEFVDTLLQPHCFAISEGDTFTYTVTTRHVNPNNNVDFLVTAKPQGMIESTFDDIGGGLKRATFTWTPTSDQYGKPFFLCFLAIDDQEGASDQHCISLLPGFDPPEVLLATRSPNGGVFSPASGTASISFSKQVRRPTTPRYITIHKTSDDSVVEMIDTSTSTAVSISSVGNTHTASFSLRANYVGNQDHYIIVEQGAFVGVDNNCPGGGPVTSNGVLNKGDWTFTTPPCVNDGDCHSNARCIGAACVCNLGFTGNGLTTCNDINECTVPSRHNCHAMALCGNTIGSFTCTCRLGYTGNGQDCVNVNECLLNTDECSDNADCTDTIGSFTCACRIGFRGTGQVCTDINECAENSDDCDGNANCVNTIGSFTCGCGIGYTGNGVTCENIDECLRGLHDCHVNADCSDTEGSFTCTCRPGFRGNGRNCVNIDECAEGTANCHAQARCDDTQGSFLCTCNSGYRGNGINCVDIDECTENTDNCHANAFCTNTPGSFICTCNSGYTGDGISCIDIDECANPSLNNCHSTARCLNLDGSFRCICPPGFTGDPINGPCVGCTANDQCHTNGICQVVTGSIRDCVCRIGFTGDGKNVCDDINECVDPNANNCHKYANCINSGGSFRCECMANFSGDGVNSCVDVSDCTKNWPVQRDRWMNDEGDWRDTTKNCESLGNNLPNPVVNTNDPPIKQWEDIVSTYINEVNAWLKDASSLNLDGIPPSVTFNQTDPEELWNALKEFMYRMIDLWYEQIGKPNGLPKPLPLGRCDDMQVQDWFRNRAASKQAEADFKSTFGDRCDAR